MAVKLFDVVRDHDDKKIVSAWACNGQEHLSVGKGLEATYTCDQMGCRGSDTTNLAPEHYHLFHSTRLEQWAGIMVMIPDGMVVIQLGQPPDWLIRVYEQGGYRLPSEVELLIARYAKEKHTIVSDDQRLVLVYRGDSYTVQGRLPILPGDETKRSSDSSFLTLSRNSLVCTTTRSLVSLRDEHDPRQLVLHNIKISNRNGRAILEYMPLSG